MTRKKLPLAVAALTAGMFGSSLAYALGMGEVRLYSHLNEPLLAEIDLIEVGDLNKEEIIVKLAPKEAFDKAGIDRDFFLTQIKYEVILKGNGQGILKLSTDKPANEPFVDVIIDAAWPNGKVLKQYTLLLDPPTYQPEGVAPSVSKKVEVTQSPPESSDASSLGSMAAADAPISAGQPQPTSEQAAETVSNQVAPTSSADASSQDAQQPQPAAVSIPSSNQTHTIERNETLWRIASQNTSGSVHDTMDAIYKLNPDAFIRGNRNLLKAGKTLRMPSAQETAFLSQGGSVQELLAMQSGAAPQLTNNESAQNSAQGAGQDRLEIVGGAQAAGGAGSAASGVAEGFDKVNRDTQEVNVKIAELTSQIKTMQQLIQLQDQQLTVLQQKLGGGNLPKEEMKQAVEQLKAELDKVSTEIDKQPTSASGAATAPAAGDATSTAAAVTVAPAPTATAQPAPAQAAAAATPVAAAPTATAKPAESSPQQAQVVEAEEESGSSWWVVLVGLLLGVGAAGAVFGKKMLEKRKAATQIESLEQADTDWASDTVELEPTFSEAEELLGETTQETSQHSEPVRHDPLEEANGLVEQGQLAAAISALKLAVAEQGTRLDLRTRLLELSVQANDFETFDAQEAYISRWGGASAKDLASRLRAEIDSKRASMPTQDSFIAPEQSAVETAPAASDLDFDIGTSDFSESNAFDLPAEETTEKTPDDELASLDHLFDDGGAAATTTSSDAEAVAIDTSVFDSGLDDFSTTLQPTEVQSAPADDDLVALDNLFGESAAAETEAVASSPVDDDLAALDSLLTEEATTSVTTDNTGDLEFDLSGLDEALGGDVTSSTVTADAAVQESAADDFTADLSLDDDLSLDAAATTDAPVAEVELSLEMEPEPAVGVAAEALSEVQLDSAPVSEAGAGVATGEDDEFSFLAGSDEAATKLDLAKAYIEMEDFEGAKDILQEVLAEGNDAQKQEAQDLIGKCG